MRDHLTLCSSIKLREKKNERTFVFCAMCSIETNDADDDDAEKLT